MTSTDYQTYADGATYTIFITTYDYIPAGGRLAILLPPDVTIEGSASNGFQCSVPSL